MASYWTAVVLLVPLVMAWSDSAPCRCSADDHQSDCAALCDWITSTNGALRAQGWGNGSSVCNWGVWDGDIYTGVTCDKLNRRPLKLILENAELSGTIPSSVGKLITLTHLSVYQNAFTGSIPFSVGQLKALTSLNVNNNALTGTLPSSLGTLTQLTGNPSMPIFVALLKPHGVGSSDPMRIGRDGPRL